MPRHLVQGCQLLEDRGVGAVGAGLALLAAGQPEFLEQYVAELLGRADVEVVADGAEDRLFEIGDAAREIARQFGEGHGVDLDPLALHRRDDRHQRPLDRLVEGGHPVANQLSLQEHMQAQHRIRPLGREVACLLRRHLGKGDQALAGADQLLQGGQLVLEAAPDQSLDRVLELAAVEHVRHQHRAVIGRERDAIARQQMRGGLEVVADLENPGILEEWSQSLDRQLQRQLTLTRLPRTVIRGWVRVSPSGSEGVLASAARWPTGT